MAETATARIVKQYEIVKGHQDTVETLKGAVKDAQKDLNESIVALGTCIDRAKAGQSEMFEEDK